MQCFLYWPACYAARSPPGVRLTRRPLRYSRQSLQVSPAAHATGNCSAGWWWRKSRLPFRLLLCSGLFLRTLRNLAAANPGFEQDHVLTASVGLNIAGYSNDEAKLIRRKILDRVSALPGVEVASLTDWIPMTLIQKRNDAYPEGYVPHPHESLLVQNAEVGPRYFESLHIPILEGREFTPEDDERAPKVLIVDQTAARRYWPGQDPLGKRLRVWGSLFTVVGVARNSTHTFVNESPEPMVYMSLFPAPGVRDDGAGEDRGESGRPGASGGKRHPRDRFTTAGFRCAFHAGEYPDGEQLSPSYRAPWRECSR